MSELDPLYVTLGMFGAMFLMLMMGAQLAFSLLTVGILFAWSLWGPGSLELLTISSFAAMDNFLLVALPMFIFMGLMLERSGIKEYEQIHIYDINNGERFTTYAIAAEPNSGIISVNGAAAHKASKGDLLIICSYVQLDEQEAETFQPTLCYFENAKADGGIGVSDEELHQRNVMTGIKNEIPVQPKDI